MRTSHQRPPDADHSTVGPSNDRWAQVVFLAPRQALRPSVRDHGASAGAPGRDRIDAPSDRLAPRPLRGLMDPDVRSDIEFLALFVVLLALLGVGAFFLGPSISGLS